MTKKYHEEMLSIPGHKGNTNQNDFEISPHYNQNDYHQKHKQCWSCSSGGEVPA
jgi:hypothetical protein